jgi:sec-independent protein translocase protein TatC
MDDTPRPLTEHLEELRRRLFWALGTWFVFACIAGLWVQDVFELMVGPVVSTLRERGYTLIAISPPELMFTYIETAIVAGFVVAVPVILYQAWGFVAPGLYSHERRFALPFVASATLLFLAGAMFGYFVAFPMIFEYFLSLESEMIRTSWSVQTVFSFMWRLYLAFGLAFELPVAMFFLSLVGIVTPERMKAGRRYAIVVMFVVGAILTPPDVVSQVLLSVPLVLLDEVGIWVSQLAATRFRRAAESTASD